jgi:hypothetical protein
MTRIPVLRLVARALLGAAIDRANGVKDFTAAARHEARMQRLFSAPTARRR